MSRPWSGSLKGQPDHRRSQRFTDQHGRTWHGVIEIKTGHPTGVLSPSWANGLTQVAANGARVKYTVPDFLVPPPTYVRPHPTDHGVLVIEYLHWIGDLKEAWKDWRSRVLKLETKFHGDKANADKPSAQTLDLAGPPPQRIELVLAMQAGNRWALGLSPKMPSWAKDMVPTSDIVTMDFPDAEEEEYLDAEDENLSRVFQQSTLTGASSEAERIAALEAALADSERSRLKAEADAAKAKEKRVVIKPRAARTPAVAGKEQG